MHQNRLMRKQLEVAGVRLGDSCSIFPFQGRKRDVPLTRHRIDLVSERHRPVDLSMSYFELPFAGTGNFHYRLELDQNADDGRFILKTIHGGPFWLNGTAAKEAYVERMDRLYIDDNKINFNPYGLGEAVVRSFEHPVLSEQNLLSSDLKILIMGETGTGKTHLAAKVHEKSGRTGKFVSVNVSSFNPQLVESELFGHKKGAFTGAIQEKFGAFQEAQHGTLFLDEIDSLPLELQTKLLTFLDTNLFRRVGEAKETLIRTRLIFAAGRPLEALVEQGKFRKDFYFRIKSGHTVELASLRNDLSRIREACHHYCIKYGISLSARLSEFYLTLAWPGNLRQLFGHLEKKRILGRSLKLDFDAFDEELLLQSSDLMSIDGIAELKPIRNVKEEYVKRAYTLCEGNLSMTARKLRVTEKTVKAILRKSN